MQKRLLIATLLTATSLLSPASWADAPNFPHLQTLGIGEVVTKADTAEISISVSLLQPTAKEAKNASDKAISDLLTRLNQMGIEKDDIENANLSVQPQYSYPKKSEPVLTGYRAIRNVNITIRQLNNINTILDGALVDGINRVNHISFSSSNEKAIKEQARLAAVNDAKSKAASLAKGFGEEIAGVWEIRYMTQSPLRPLMMRMSSERNNIDADYVESKITFRDQVEAIFMLK